MKREKSLLILDGQGGGVGRKIAEKLLENHFAMKYIVVGTNAVATSNMMKAGITVAATGENAWIYNCKRADVIVGPIGIIFANSMHGEISAKMAKAVASCSAKRILIPVPNQHVSIAGLPDLPLQNYLEEMLDIIRLEIHS